MLPASPLCTSVSARLQCRCVTCICSCRPCSFPGTWLSEFSSHPRQCGGCTQAPPSEIAVLIVHSTLLSPDLHKGFFYCVHMNAHSAGCEGLWLLTCAWCQGATIPVSCRPVSRGLKICILCGNPPAPLNSWEPLTSSCFCSLAFSGMSYK